MSHFQPQMLAVVKPKVFREYIGVKQSPESLRDFPAEIINKHITEFHFILGIATEQYGDDGKGTGWFSRTWDYDNFSPEKVKTLKKNHSNVKVIISIGGRGAGCPFNPSEKNIWIAKAVRSIKEIIQDYQIKDECCCHHTIDGIDINYECINSNEEDFSYCIGNVIQQLKDDADVPINVVSVAPSDLVRPHYKKLYWDNKPNIHWVAYQFYNQNEKVSSEEKFVHLYKSLLKEYSADILLAGVSTDPNDAAKMPREVFIDACTHLISTKSLPGIFVWNANDSATPQSNDDERFFLEILLQGLLTHHH